MSIWDILGIEPTADIKAIRRAYAAQAKTFHPEEKPEEFQRLYWAYQQALAEVTDNEPPREEAIESKAQMEEAALEQSNMREPPPRGELDFAALFRASAVRRFKRLEKETALGGIAERLRNEKRRNNRLAWKMFFFSDEYLRFHIRRDAMELLAEYLNTQEIVPADDLPRPLCVWLGILAGVEFYELTDNRKKLEALAPIANLLNRQQNAQYNASEAKKPEYQPSRVCFGLFGNFLDEYPYLQGADAEEWKKALFSWGMNRGSYHETAAGSDYAKLVAYAVRSLKLPDSSKLMLFRHYELQNYQSSSKKEEKRPVYEALAGTVDKLLSKAKADEAFQNLVGELIKMVYDLFRSLSGDAGITDSDIDGAEEKMRALLADSRYIRAWFSPRVLERLSDYNSGAEKYWRLLRAALDMYESHTEEPGIPKFIEATTLKREQELEDAKNRAEKPPLTFYGIPEDIAEPFTVLKDMDAILRERTAGFDYQSNILLAAFAMARTCFITDILKPIDERLERYHLRHIRDMTGCLLKWLTGEPIEKHHCNWWFYRETARRLTGEIHFDAEDVERVTDRPEIIFVNYESFASTWYRFSDFEFKQPEGAEALLGMTGGFVLYPMSMLLRVGYDGEKRKPLIEAEWRRVQEDIVFLSEPRSYAGLAERLEGYLGLNIFEMEN